MSPDMCGIAVAVEWEGARDVRPWAAPLMRHRGPDAQGVLVDREQGIVLEACRLAIIDPGNRQADQPLTDPTGRWTIAYNGEVYNYRELRMRLTARGVAFRTGSDTEVVLESFIAEGAACLQQLRGMFAFVVWDHETGELFAARDQIGVKPLYYTLTDDVFVAASELRTVLGHPGVRAGLDLEAAVEHLAFGNVSDDRTLVSGIKRLPPGHALRFRGGEVEIFEWWDVLPPEWPERNGDLAALVLERLDEAVAGSLVSDVPVALMLSGGLDSSAIAALATRHGDPSALTAYVVSFGLPTDEGDAAARLASELGLRCRPLTLTPELLSGEFDGWLDTLDVPSADPTWLAVSQIARAAREDGMKVLLSGDGGDELFGGYRRWMTYLRFHDRWWARTPNTLRRTGGRVVRSLAHGLAGDVARRAAEGGELFVGSRPFHDDDLRRLLGPAGRAAGEAAPPEAPLRALRRRFDERLPGGDYLAWMSYVTFKRHLVDDYLTRLDAMGMQQSVEGRVPLLDPHLARLAFGLTQAEKVDGYEQKALFRRAVAPILPEHVLTRPKQGFSPPVVSWAGDLLAARVGVAEPLVELGLLAPDAMGRLAASSSTNRSFALWAAGTLSAWVERHL